MSAESKNAINEKNKYKMLAEEFFDCLESAGVIESPESLPTNRRTIEDYLFFSSHKMQRPNKNMKKMAERLGLPANEIPIILRALAAKHRIEQIVETLGCQRVGQEEYLTALSSRATNADDDLTDLLDTIYRHNCSVILTAKSRGADARDLYDQLLTYGINPGDIMTAAEKGAAGFRIIDRKQERTKRGEPQKTIIPEKPEVLDGQLMKYDAFLAQCGVPPGCTLTAEERIYFNAVYQTRTLQDATSLAEAPSYIAFCTFFAERGLSTAKIQGAQESLYERNNARRFGNREPKDDALIRIKKKTESVRPGQKSKAYNSTGFEKSS